MAASVRGLSGIFHKSVSTSSVASQEQVFCDNLGANSHSPTPLPLALDVVESSEFLLPFPQGGSAEPPSWHLGSDLPKDREKETSQSRSGNPAQHGLQGTFPRVLIPCHSLMRHAFIESLLCALG